MNTPTGPPAQSQTRAGGGSGAAPPAPPRQTMQAIVQAGYGSADVLRRAEIDKPVIGDDEVLIRVQAAGLDRGTWHLMTGKPYLIRLVSGLRTPKSPVPGLDVAGTVVTTGAAVTRFKPGDEVFGISKGSQHVLIIGASGGVGTFAVQIAKALGTEVTGVCSTAKTGLVASIGADHVIDYTKNDFADGTQRYDLIRLAGNTPLPRLRQALTPAGTLVIAGGEDAGRWTGMGRQVLAMALSPFAHQRLTSLLSRQRQADLEHLAQLIETGKVTPVIGKTYPLHQAPDAMRDLEAGCARGKPVITVTEAG